MAAEYGTPQQHHFDPYAQNGGTVLAIAGSDFALVASDIRLSEGYEILSRDCPKVHKLTDGTLLGAAGFHGDALQLNKMLHTRLKMYEHEHQKTMSTRAIAQLLSNTLYYRRFFPLYAYCVLAGLDETGKGAVYSYDPVGSYERETYRAGGSASALLQPLLDNQLGRHSHIKAALTKERAMKLVKDVFIAAGEREIYTGDAVEIQVVTAAGIEVERFALRRD